MPYFSLIFLSLVGLWVKSGSISCLQMVIFCFANEVMRKKKKKIPTVIHIVQNAIIHAVFIQGIFIKHLLCSKVIRDSVVNTNRKILYF